MSLAIAKDVMRLLARSNKLARTLAGSALTLLCCVASGFTEEFSVPSPFQQAPARLKNLSGFLDQHLKIVQSVNRIASKQGSAAKSPPLTQLGATVAIENMMRIQGLESAVRPLQLDFLQDHQRELESFSRSVRQIGAEISSLPPAAARDRLDAIVVPPDLQQLLQLGADGRTLPPPPHLQGSSSNPSMTLTPFVVGPGSATTVDYPSVVEIAYAWQGLGASALCTGTLISSNAILTAAHCFCELARVRAGPACLTATYSRGLEPVKTTDTRFVTVFFQDRGAVPVSEIIINPDYDFPRKDLAIVKLAQEVTDIMPAPLNTGRSLKPGEFATIVGFGAHGPMRADGSPAPGPPVSASEGIKLWATIRTAPCNGSQFDEAMCWSYQERMGDQILGSTCHGDSGGPSFATIDGTVRLVGVTSGGPGDCHAGPDQSFDVDVQKNTAWITSVAGPNSNPAFAANPAAFVSNPAVRAYGAPYHLFVNRPDQSTGNFFVPASIASMKISVNTTPTFAALTIEVVSPIGGATACTATSSDAFATCEVVLPASGTWQVRITGSSPQESQVVATVTR